MLQSVIEKTFETFCSTQVSRQRAQELFSIYLSQINRRIDTYHSFLAQDALKKMLRVALGCDSELLKQKLLRALLQLCREADNQFTPEQDAELVRSINDGSYFLPLPPLYVETQDGVI